METYQLTVWDANQDWYIWPGLSEEHVELIKRYLSHGMTYIENSKGTESELIMTSQIVSIRINKEQ